MARGEALVAEHGFVEMASFAFDLLSSLAGWGEAAGLHWHCYQLA